MPAIPASPALSRCRILDLTRVRAGPTCVRQFADFGADVIKIEMPPRARGHGRAARRAGFPEPAPQQALDHAQPQVAEGQGRSSLKLAKTADVVVENYRPDVKYRLGIDYESLEEGQPRIILASISGFGQDGPYRERPGFDQIAQGMSGLMSVTGKPGRGPDARRAPRSPTSAPACSRRSAS